jgi:hypothetical protein
LLSQKLFIFCISRFPREFRLYLHPPSHYGRGRALVLGLLVSILTH